MSHKRSSHAVERRLDVEARNRERQRPQSHSADNICVGRRNQDAGNLPRTPARMAAEVNASCRRIASIGSRTT